MFATRQFTIETLKDQKARFNQAAGRIFAPDTQNDMNVVLNELESILNELAERGRFERPDDRRTKIYGSDDALEQEHRAEDALDAKAARLLVAMRGLSILQKAIPTLTDIGNRCLEVAGKEAVRIACAPTQREGTNHEGNPYKPIPSQFTLPPGYESSLVDKVKSALKR